jgi:hypothetical protein
MKNFNLTTVSRTCVSVLLAAALLSSCLKVKIVQTTHDAKICENTVYVSTNIYTYKYGFIVNTK